MRLRARAARETAGLFRADRAWLCRLLQCRWTAECRRDGLDEIALLAHDEAFAARCGEVCARIRIVPQSSLVCLIRSKTIERDQAPADVVGAFMRQEIADEMTAATRDDARPPRRVFLEC